MSPAVSRVLLHTVHLLTFVAVFATGVLLFVPDLRAAVTGGHSLVIREAHRWGGVVFAGLPAVLIAMVGARKIFVAPGVPTLRTYWQRLHTAFTVFLTVVFTVTGFVLWGKRFAPEPILEMSRALHDGLTYAVAPLVGLHLCEVGVAALVERIKMGETRQP
ncbi:MAG: hypothetical protein HY270_17565 [Deltaproteobacteria bacterium]|nr:hypothetical protein [Deltaproteobacteria bacterium]